MTIDLTLIGTQHMDLKGPRRLRKALERLNPDVVSVEYDEQRAGIADQMTEKLKSEIFFETVFEGYLCMFPDAHEETLRQYIRSTDFEYRVAKKYSQERGILLDLHDTLDAHANAVDAMQEGTEKNKTFERLFALNPMQHAKRVREFYDAIEEGELTAEEIEGFAARDAETAKHIKELQGKVVRISGIVHTHAKYRNLYEHCAVLSPRRMKLCEVDSPNFGRPYTPSKP